MAGLSRTGVYYRLFIALHKHFAAKGTPVQFDNIHTQRIPPPPLQLDGFSDRGGFNLPLLIGSKVVAVYLDQVDYWPEVGPGPILPPPGRPLRSDFNAYVTLLLPPDIRSWNAPLAEPGWSPNAARLLWRQDGFIRDSGEYVGTVHVRHYRPEFWHLFVQY